MDSILSNQDASQKAIEALRLILRKLPNKLTTPPKDNNNDIQVNDDNDDDNNNDLLHDNHKLVQLQHNLKQFGIPHDPNQIPEFKPLKSLTSTYTFHMGPFESVTKHTIGGLDTSVENGVFNVVPPHNTQSQQSTNQLYYDVAPYRGQRHTSNTNANPKAHPLDIYHTMTLKNSAKTHHHHHHPQSNQINHSQNNNKKNVKYLNEQHHSNNNNNNNNVPSQPLIYLSPQSNSPSNFEIQKSIQYQLQ